MNKQGDLIFTLDIGTRTVIGLVVKYHEKEDYYEILASAVTEHEKRVMLDGQIHNINLVVDEVKKIKKDLEKKLDLKLESAAIAAAGRALKTVEYNNVVELEERRMLTEEDVQNLEFSAVQKAQVQLASAEEESDGSRDYHFVGYSVQEYTLDGMHIGRLEGQRGRKIEVRVIATFLPRVVIDSLLTVINKAGLNVSFLTLEPIAAANVVIPKDMYNFNLALVDIGAGTSDIAITQGGSMIAYEMVPVAGDEITEALAENYLLDYKTGEKVKCLLKREDEIRAKNILSQEVVIKSEEAVEEIKSVVDSVASQISEAVLMLNQKPPQALICVGGGSLTPGLLEQIAKFMDINPQRVGVKEYIDIANVEGEVKELDNAQINTPIGIALSSHQEQNKAKFVDVEVNGQKVQIFSLNRATLVDALISADKDVRKLQGLPGMGLTCTVNGKMKIIKGEIGTSGKVLINNKEVSNLEQEIESGDEIIFKAGKEGRNAQGVIADVVPQQDKILKISINDEEIEITPEIYQNGVKVSYDTPLEDGAEIDFLLPETVRDIAVSKFNVDFDNFNNKFSYYKLNDMKYYLPEDKVLILHNGVPIDLDLPLTEGMELEIIEKEVSNFNVKNLMENHFDDKISISFNNNELEVPVRGNVYCNKQKVNEDYIIKSRDELVYKSRAVSVRYIFDYVNYTITPFFDEFTLTINGEEAALDDFVEDGDKIAISRGD